MQHIREFGPDALDPAQIVDLLGEARGELGGEGLAAAGQALAEASEDAGPIVPAGIANGVIVNRTAETVVRLLPPLNITEAEANEALNRLDAALAAVGAA